MAEPERERESELGSRGEKGETRASHHYFYRSKPYCRRRGTNCCCQPQLLVILNCCTVVAAVLVIGCGVGDHRNHHRSYRYFNLVVRPSLASRCYVVTGAAVAPFSRLFVSPVRLS
ncbi:uncharacterized protein LOC110270947 isoform X2 [Arachis ipaensis]|uniref:uncharacterized protein LOC110270947 isoform X2 n=1 Tax=Arachis ipaensis TaxID=130454 RepID=UPI000A2B4C84|nr:uncharacterized protein LOC110270947 isoform X2 [Arachis ipaensis]